MNQRQRTEKQKQQQNLISWFNANYEKDDTVELRASCGTIMEDRVKSKAFLMGGHTAVANFKNNGAFMLERVVDKNAPVIPCRPPKARIT